MSASCSTQKFSKEELKLNTELSKEITLLVTFLGNCAFLFLFISTCKSYNLIFCSFDIYFKTSAYLLSVDLLILWIIIRGQWRKITVTWVVSILCYAKLFISLKFQLHTLSNLKLKTIQSYCTNGLGFFWAPRLLECFTKVQCFETILKSSNERWAFKCLL